MNVLKTYIEKVGDWANKRLGGDKIVWTIVFILSMFSIAAVYSASSYIAMDTNTSKIVIFLEQFGMAVLGWCVLLVAYFLPPKFYRKYAILIYFISIAVLLMLFIPPLRAEYNGAVRGIKIGSASIQVFDAAKVALLLYIARVMERYEIKDFKTYLIRLLIPIGLTCVLLLTGSFSSALFMGAICLVILWINKINWKYLLATLAIGAGVFLACLGLYEATKGSENPMFRRFATAESRISNFFSPASSDEATANLTDSQKQRIKDEERQSENAKIAIHEGGLIGKGPGKSTQRYTLSMAFSDFIYAFIIEEYGSIVGILVMFMYIWLFARCARIAYNCKTTFASTIVFGLGLLITAQAMMHIYVNIRMFPITGHTLPLVSHGGMAYLVFSGAFGIILSISRSIQEIDINKVDNEGDN